MQAVIIAAGCGKRLHQTRPKQMMSLFGLTLLERTILTVQKAGIKDVVVVLGYRAGSIKSAIEKKFSNLSIQWVNNKEWKGENGHSILVAKPYIKDDFILLMGDHVLQPGLLTSFINSQKERKADDEDIVLAIDSKIASVYDLDDACKVSHQGFRIKKIGKHLCDYNAIDAGIFYCTPLIFKALGLLKDRRDFPLSLMNTVFYLAELKQVRCWDIGGYKWQDVDTKETLREAKRLLLSWCRKPTDGIISKYINRFFSLSLSPLLIRLKLSANFITFLNLVVGLVSCFFAFSGEFLHAFIWFQVSSIFDGCDGEVAKLTLTQSEKGAWLDTVSDNIIYVLFIFSYGFGLREYYSDEGYLIYTSLSLFFVLAALMCMYSYLKIKKKQGTLVLVERAVHHLARKKQVFLSFVPRHFSFIVKRDFFAFTFMVLAFFDQWNLILGLIVVGSFLIFSYSLSLVHQKDFQELYEASSI